MLTLITGSLGTGKTALAIKLVTESKYYPDNAVIVGVREWQGGGAYYPLKSQQHATENQQFIESIGTLSGTVYFVDEAKKIWPSRIAGKPVPPFIDTHLAESRSIEQDWILTAQAPTQIDVALRRLIGRHIHLELTPFGVKYSESGQIRDDLKFSRDESRKYEFPVESLKLYRSDDGVSDAHKKGLKTPKRLIYMGILIVFLIGLIYYFYSQSTIFGGAETTNTIENDFIPKSGSNMFTSNRPSHINEILPLTHAPSIYYYLPKDTAFPELAKAPRIPQSCLRKTETECICYDQYNQRIEKFPLKRCNDIINGVNQIAFTLAKPKEKRALNKLVNN